MNDESFALYQKRFISDKTEHFLSLIPNPYSLIPIPPFDSQ